MTVSHADPRFLELRGVPPQTHGETWLNGPESSKRAGCPRLTKRKVEEAQTGPSPRHRLQRSHPLGEAQDVRRALRGRAVLPSRAAPSRWPGDRGPEPRTRDACPRLPLPEQRGGPLLSPPSWSQLVRKPSWDAGGRARGPDFGERLRGQTESLSSGEGLRDLQDFRFLALLTAHIATPLPPFTGEIKTPDSHLLFFPRPERVFSCVVTCFAFSPACKSQVAGPCSP